MKHISLVFILACNLIIADCDKALTLCGDAIEQQSNQIVHLMDENKALREEIKKSEPPIMPVWVWASLGAFAGASTYIILHK